MNRLTLPMSVCNIRARHAEHISAMTFNVSLDEIRKPNRGIKEVARARQVAMYLCNTSLGVSINRTAKCFGRDRRTARHGIRTIEEMRSDKEFDMLISRLEKSLRNGGYGCADTKRNQSAPAS